jgi:hypothetical protein
MALLGLFLLPSDFRAGAETAHGHALVQLWVDARDGVIEHHHQHAQRFQNSHLAGYDWFDPAAGVSDHLDPRGVNAEDPDLGGHSDSAPAASGIAFLLAAAVIVPAVAIARAPAPGRGRPLVGRTPPILLPPPRWTFAA